MKEPNQNQAFLLLTTKATGAITDAYHAIREATQHLGDAFLLYHQQEPQLPAQLEKISHFAFNDATLSELNYIPIGFRVVPGNTHFPLFDFLSRNTTYDYYWVIEDDVRFSGDWKYFFDAFSGLDRDFLSSHIRTPAQEPDWSWWHYLANPYRVIPFENRLRSFNPIYRLSAKAVRYLGEAFRAYWCGHYEVMLATLLKEGGLSMADFGGTGEFVLPGYENKFYLSASPGGQGELSGGTMRYRPAFAATGSEANKLYHPVKS
jgi:hypothetical protein